MSFNPQTYLQEKYPHPRDKNITFDEPSHIYTIKLAKKREINTSTNIEKSKNENKNIVQEYEYEYDSGFTSVTTWVHSHFQTFDADKIIDKMMKSPKWTKSKYYGMTKEEIKQEWERNRDEAAEAGTNMHYDIECFYNKNPNKENKSIEYQYFQQFEKDRTVEGGFGENLEPYRTEWMVYDEELRLSGSIDMIFRETKREQKNQSYKNETVKNETEKNTNEITNDKMENDILEHDIVEIYDWKRCREIKKHNSWQSAKTECINHLPDTNYWHYSLQLNIYKAILERNYGKKVNGLYLVCLHPDNKNGSYQRIKVPELKGEIQELIELRKQQVKEYYHKKNTKNKKEK